MSKIIAISNQKGGVGKTTTAISLSGCFSKLGYSILLIDMDPQGNATRGIGLDPTAIRKNLFDALSGTTDINKVIKKTQTKGVDVLPSNLKLATLESTIGGVEKPFNLLKECLTKISKPYDFIIIDCPPSLGLLNLNALCAANSVIIPVQCEYYAMEAVAQILSSISKVQKEYNPDLEILGFLLTMYDSRIKLATEVTTEIRGLFREKTFVTQIPRNISLAEAPFYGKPVNIFRPKATGSLAYLSLAKEILNG
ncbi:MAG: ParA family protein [Bacilli bacterium]|nr:ParA family protein [Bacillales bacterium]MDY2574566.1 ParA family protein [Bacilli bacterium]